MPDSIDRDANDIERGKQASGVLRAADPFINELFHEIANRIAREGATMTDQELRFHTGEMSGLQRFRQRLETQTEKGRIAADRRR